MTNGNQIVHALLHGLPLCEFSIDVPAKWPPGHQWTEIRDIGNINCTGCKRKAEMIAQSSSKGSPHPLVETIN